MDFFQIITYITEYFLKDFDEELSLGTKTLKLCQCDSSFHSGLCFDSEIRLAFENRFYSERVVVQSCPDLNDDAYSDYPELNESLFQSCNLNWVTV